MARRRRRRQPKGISITPLAVIIVLLILPQAKSLYSFFMPLLIILLFTGAYFLFGKPIAGYMQARRYLQSSIEDVDSLSGHEFEHFLAPLYEQQGYRAKVTKGSGEYGADLILKRKGCISIIQAKCYGEGKKVGVKAVQEVVGALAMYKASEGIVVTNRFFTKPAENLAKANRIKLVDRHELAELMYKYGRQPNKQLVESEGS